MRSAKADSASAAGRSSLVTGIPLQIIATGPANQQRLQFRKPEHTSWQAPQAFNAQYATPSFRDFPCIDDDADAVGVDEIEVGHVQHDGRSRARLCYLQQQRLQFHRREIELAGQGNDNRTVPALSRPTKRGRLAVRNADVRVCHRDTSHLRRASAGSATGLSIPFPRSQRKRVPDRSHSVTRRGGSGGVRACRRRRAAELYDHIAVAGGAIRAQLAEAGEHAH